MKRFRPLDLFLLLALTPLWIGCFILHVQEVWSGRLAWVPIVVSPPQTQNGYPTVSEIWARSAPKDTNLAVGDILLRVGDSDLRGVDRLGFLARAYETANGKVQPSVVFLRANKEMSGQLELLPVTFPCRLPPLVLGLVGVAVTILWQKPGAPLTRAVFLASFAYSFHWMFFFGGGQIQTYLWLFVFLVSSFTMFSLVLRVMFLLSFETLSLGQPHRHHWALWSWGFALYGLMQASWILGWPFSSALGLQGNFLFHCLFILILIALFCWSYVAGPLLGWRKIKWVIAGFLIGMIPVLMVNFPPLVGLHDHLLAFVERVFILMVGSAPSGELQMVQLHELSMVPMTALPFFIWIAVLHADLFDIDRLMSRTITLILSFLIVVVCAAITLSLSSLEVLPPVQQSSSPFLWIGFWWETCRSLKQVVDKRFFPERAAFEKGSAALIAKFQESRSPARLLPFLANKLNRLLSPESCLIYQLENRYYAPTYKAKSRSAPDKCCLHQYFLQKIWRRLWRRRSLTPVSDARPSFEPPVISLASPLVRALRSSECLNVEDWQREIGHIGDPSAKAVFDTMDKLRARIILPLDETTPPRYFLCLGAKNSGDIYIAAELSKLAEIAKAAAKKLSGPSPTGAAP
ncbi:MAG: hypothetical protein HYZ50_15180 [Deltaproteobacteria bacterium]|nr:hypothetical protein [Deltaproteobacteria bacterium]